MEERTPQFAPDSKLVDSSLAGWLPAQQVTGRLPAPDERPRDPQPAGLDLLPLRRLQRQWRQLAAGRQDQQPPGWRVIG